MEDGSENDAKPRKRSLTSEETPLAKKIKETDEQEVVRQVPAAPRPPLKCSDFVVTNLENYYKSNPPFRLPTEVGCFSFNGEGQQVLGRSGLRYYSPPGASRLAGGLDLNVGYDGYKPKAKTNVADLGQLLTWISHKWDVFLVKLQNQKSIDFNDVSTAAVPIATTSTNTDDPPTKFHLRPTNLHTDIICWRGLMTKLLCTPYNKTEPWKMVATLYNGTIYLQEMETEEKRQREEGMSAREKVMCYWGLKFEDYMTTKTPGEKSSGQSKTGSVNPNESFCTVVRTRLNTHSLVMAGEVDCFDQSLRDKPPQNYVELKTSRFIYTDRNKASFKRNKLLKWWAQSYLVGVPKVICGFRNDDGIVNTLQTFKTVDIPKECQSDSSLWQAPVCLNFLDELLKWLKATVIDDNPKTVYIIEWNKPYNYIKAARQLASLTVNVLPQWYIDKSQPPSHLSS